MDKRTQLKALLDEDPKDSFLLFALAKEWEKYNSETAIKYYLQLKSLDPEYLALYFHLGQLYYEEKQIEKSRETLTAGLAVAKQQGDKKTEGELRELLLIVEMTD